MTPKDLNETEQLALMGLLKLTVSADAELSDAESSVMLEVANQLGRAAFIAARERAQQQLATRADIDQALAAVERPEARRLLHGIASAVAEADGKIEAETDVLQQVAKIWGIEVAG